MSQPPEQPGTPPDPHGGTHNSPGYPPPPPGYGPPPLPPQGYGPPAGWPPQPGWPAPGGQPQPQFNVGAAVSWSWNMFSANALPFVVAGLAYGLVLAALNALVFVVNPGATASGSDDYYSWDVASQGPASWAFMVVAYIAVYAVAIFAEAGFVTGCLDVADGGPTSIGSFFRPRNLGGVVVAALLLGVITAVLSALCFLPGIIFGFFAMFTVPFVVDRSVPAAKALTASFSTVSSHLGSTLVSYLVQFALILVGALACGVGLLVTAPVAALVLIYTYRRLSGGRVVAPPQQGYRPGPPPGPNLAT